MSEQMSGDQLLLAAEQAYRDAQVEALKKVKEEVRADAVTQFGVSNDDVVILDWAPTESPYLGQNKAMNLTVCGLPAEAVDPGYGHWYFRFNIRGAWTDWVWSLPQLGYYLVERAPWVKA